MSKLIFLIAAVACIAHFHLTSSELININCPTACILKSCDGGYGLYFDGHMKLFKHDTNGNQVAPPVWQDNAPSSNTQLSFQGDGNFCINSAWCAYTHDYDCPAGKGARTFQVTSSGQLQALTIDGSLIWTTPTPIPGTTQNRYASTCCLDGVHNKGCTLVGAGQ